VIGKFAFSSVKVIHAKAADHKKELNPIYTNGHKIGQIDLSYIKPGIAVNCPGMYP
jgi:hypothetical protein